MAPRSPGRSRGGRLPALRTDELDRLDGRSPRVAGAAQLPDAASGADPRPDPQRRRAERRASDDAVAERDALELAHGDRADRSLARHPGFAVAGAAAAGVSATIRWR